MAAPGRLINWGIFLALSLIWGSSFILMKIGLEALSAYQVAALRIFSAGIVLLPAAIGQIRKLPKARLILIITSGMLGSFFPAFLFCIAETKIDSYLAGIINALTPIITMITGVVFSQSRIQWQKVMGVLTSFAGLCILLVSKGKIGLDYLSYAGLVLLATLCYGINVNMVSRYLKDVGSLNIAAIAISFLLIPSLLVLYYTGYFQLPLLESNYLFASTASVILGVMGTALASIIFYMLVKRAGIIFPSMVTYVIPCVAIFWGSLYNEMITFLEIGCLAIILAGVFLTNKN